MKLAIHMDRKDGMPISDWEEFLAHARRAGAPDTAQVSDHFDDDDRNPSGYVIEFDAAAGASAPEFVRLPTGIVHDLLHIARVVANSDGDVRGLVTDANEALQQVYEHLAKPSLGPNPWDDSPK